MTLRSRIAILGPVVLLLCLPNYSAASPVTRPPDLELGESYRLAFLTSETRNATSSDIADYNAFVTQAANDVPELALLATQWFAIASTATVNARDNTGTTPPGNVPVYLLNGVRIADSYDDLWDWSIAAAIDFTELCTTADGSLNVWTGSWEDGTAALPLGGAPNSTIGSRSAINEQWIVWGATVSSALHRLYGISDVITVDSVAVGNSTWGKVKALFR